MKALPLWHLLESGFLFSLTLLLVLAGCGKQEVSPVAQQALIVGRWQLRQTSGGIGGGTRPADPNQKRELVLTADGRAQFLLNGAVEVPTGYAVRRAYLPLTSQQETIVDFGAPASSYANTMIIRELTATKLLLQEAYADGFNYEYGRP